MNANHQEIVDELGFGVVPSVFSAAHDDGQSALWKGVRHVVLRGRLPRTAKEGMGVLVSREAGSRYAAGIHLHALTLQGVDALVLDGLRDGRIETTVPERTAAPLRFALAAPRDPHDPAHAEALARDGLSRAEVEEAVAVVGLFRRVDVWTDVTAVPLDAL